MRWSCFILYLSASSVVRGTAFAPSVKLTNKNQNNKFFNNNNQNVLRPNKNSNNRNGLSQLASAVPFSSAPPTNETSVVFASRAGAFAAPLTTTSVATPTNTKASAAQKTVISTCALLMLDFAFKRILKASGLSFPSSLAGMGVLFATLLMAPFGEGLYQLLQPGSNLMAKWLQVFLVPNLVILPLAPSLGSTMEVSILVLRKIHLLGGMSFGQNLTLIIRAFCLKSS